MMSPIPKDRVLELLHPLVVLGPYLDLHPMSLGYSYHGLTPQCNSFCYLMRLKSISKCHISNIYLLKLNLKRLESLESLQQNTQRT